MIVFFKYFTLVLAVTSSLADSEFVLTSGTNSPLFKNCFDDANTVTGSLYSIEVDTDIEYIHLTVTPDESVTWLLLNGSITTIVECAFAAFQQEALIFRYDNDLCEVIGSGMYNPNNPACEGDSIYYLETMLTYCFTTTKGAMASDATFTNGNCITKCDNGKLVDGETNATISDIPDEVLQCCPSSETPCIYLNSTQTGLFCDAVARCTLLGLSLADVYSVQEQIAIHALVNSFDPPLMLWVNIQNVDGSWMHVSSGIWVDVSLWSTEPTESDNDKCVYFNQEGSIQFANCSDTAYSYACVDKSASLSAC